MSRNVVIIGGVAAGPKAAARIKRCDPQAKVTLVDEGTYISYAGCGLPFYVGGMMEKEEELMTTPAGAVRNPAFFKAVKDIDVLIRARAEKVNRDNKTVEVKNLETGEKKDLSYDKLVLTTGGSPVMPPIPGNDLKGVVTLNNVEMANEIKQTVEQNDIKNVTIIGAGLIGLEVAEMLGSKEDKNVNVVEMMEHVLPALLDKDMALVVEKHLRKNGVNLYTSTRVQEIKGEGSVQEVITDNGNLPSELVVVAAGVNPKTELAVDAGIEIGTTGGIKVNKYMQTSDPDIYAGGDCVENIHLITKEPAYTPLGSVANKHGRVIGDNICDRQEEFIGVLGTAIAKVFQFTIGRTGLSVGEAEKNGYSPESNICVFPDRAHFYPGAGPVMIKLITDKNTRKLLGAQLTGPGSVDKRLDIIVAALSMEATVDQLAMFDLAYSPPYATAIDVLTHAANSMRNKLDGLAKALNPLQVSRMMTGGEQFVFLDVRSPGEYEEGILPYDNVMYIPLGKLRERYNELPVDRKVVIFCKISMRGYDAQRILEGLGFENVYFMEGGIATWPFEVGSVSK